jgi:hypothetical protein
MSLLSSLSNLAADRSVQSRNVAQDIMLKTGPNVNAFASIGNRSCRMDVAELS